MAQACGKVILLGEHAVVYGVPALAAGIDRGADASARAAPESTLRLGDRRASADDGSELGRAFAALLGELGAPSMDAEARVSVPPGCGLGASAAISVALARAVLDVCEPESALGESARFERVFRAATAWERVYHGNPSGIDAAAAASGGCIQFIRGEGVKPLFVKRDLELGVAVAGPPASTREMVEGLAKLRERKPEIVNKALSGIESLVQNARTCLASGDVSSLGQLMNLNQMLLSGLFLSTEGIERACHVAREAGALGAKLTGSGGGGCVIALLDGNADAVLSAWRSAGFECFATRVRATAGATP